MQNYTVGEKIAVAGIEYHLWNIEECFTRSFHPRGHDIEIVSYIGTHSKWDVACDDIGGCAPVDSYS